MQEEFFQSLLWDLTCLISTSYLDKEMEWAFIKLEDDSKLWGAIRTLQSMATIQEDQLPASGKTKGMGKKESH